MMYLIDKLCGRRLSEAEAFFAEKQGFPFARASITVIASANLAATVATLLGQSWF